MLTNLIYTSKRNNNCNNQEIYKILEACNKNNSHKDITGVPLFSDSLFLQYLEGERKDIFELYDKIKLDNRHNDAVMVGCRPIKERIFPDWSMGKKDIGQEGFEFISGDNFFEKKRLDSILENQDNEQLVSSIKKFFEARLQ